MNLSELGLKCGIEIHQQLEGKKLFCSCPTILRDDNPHFKVKRKLRAMEGEGGKIDIAAMAEQNKNKFFVYEGYHDTTCLVEIDEEPPHEINQEALYTTLQLSKIMNADIASIIQVMRKTVVDGSNTSGFQRTALVARNGKISTSTGEVRIDNINLEEDSCKNISETPEERTYRMDRLGIPLIEIGTAADITSPQQCQEAAKKIGLLLRSLTGVKRGLGTIRQDVNVSIAGGNRIENKGAQDLHQLPLLVEYEAKRQHELLKIKMELKVIKLNQIQIIDLTNLFVKSTSKIIEKTIKDNGKVLGIRLTGFAGYIGRELMSNYRLGTEFSGRAKMYAGVGGIFHSDELPSYGISDEDVANIKKVLHCSFNDAFVLVSHTESNARLGLEAVYQRAQEVLIGIPKEVRKANQDGTTSFIRPLSGSARMYPETDVPLIKPNISKIKLPELLEEKIRRYQQRLGISKDLAEFVAKSDKMLLFEELVQTYPTIKPAFIAETITSSLLEIKRKYSINPDVLEEDQFRELFKYLMENKIHKDIVLDVLIDMCKGTFKIEKYAALGTEKIHQVLKEIVEKNSNAPFSALMGMAMKQLSGKASGEFISSELRKIVEKGHR